MKLKRRYITSGLAIAAAVLTAHLMQRSGGLSTPAGTSQVAGVSAASAAAVSAVSVSTKSPPNEVVLVAARPVEASDAATETLARPGSLPRPPQDVLMPKALPQVGAELQNRMANSSSGSAGLIGKEPPRNEFGLRCEPSLSAIADENAIVQLTLTAPCQAQELITVRHGPLAFNAKLDAMGSYTVGIPALETKAAFSATFADGQNVTTELAVPAAAGFDRVALAFEGESGLQIHALEYGADYGEDGHVWAGNPRDATTAARVGGGYMVSLGDPDLETPMQAEIYTFPQDTKTSDGVIRLSVEAEVTAYNCDSEIAGQTMERAADGTMSSVSLTVEIPACSAIGEYLVLKNLLRDMKIASN